MIKMFTIRVFIHIVSKFAIRIIIQVLGLLVKPNQWTNVHRVHALFNILVVSIIHIVHIVVFFFFLFLLHYHAMVSNMHPVSPTHNLRVRYSFTMGIKLHIISSGSSMSSSINSLSNQLDVKFWLSHYHAHYTYFACFEVSSSFTASYIWNKSFAAFSEELCTLNAAWESTQSQIALIVPYTGGASSSTLDLFSWMTLYLALCDASWRCICVTTNSIRNWRYGIQTFCSLTRRSFRSSIEVGVCGLLVPGWIRLEIRSWYTKG